MFASASDAMAEVAELLRAPRRITPVEAATRYLSNERGPWSLDLTPMWAEPLNMVASREYRGIVAVGPARAGKTLSLVHGAMAYTVICAPADMLIVQMSQDSARDFSRTEVDRVIRSSPELAARLSPRADQDNVFDKVFRAGNILKLGWPTITQLASRTFQLAIITDYDRPPNHDDVDGEGPLFTLTQKRTETFMSRGTCLAESSPGEDIVVGNWRPATPHEAPPARGIMGLYNAGTRARWFWACKHCGSFFQAEPGPGAFCLPNFDELTKLVIENDLNDLVRQYARVPCKSCGGLHDQVDRIALNRGGKWLHEGESVVDGVVTGERRKAPIASYWLGGVAAAFQRWDAMVFRYLAAVQTFAKLGDESQLRAVTNADFGAAYMPRSMEKKRTGQQLAARAENWTQGTVPAGVRFLTAAVDVQAHRFVIQVHGWGAQMESWLIDRFTISSSKRPEGARFAALDPGAYLEDWDILREEMVGRSYPLESNPAKRMPVRLTVCDSGGREGVTSRAYDFWRSLRHAGHGGLFVLVKGRGTRDAPRVEKTFPDSTGRRDRPGGGRGDVPVFLLGVDALKDSVANDLLRDAPGPGYVHLPAWLDPSIFEELTAEVRTPKGWTRPSGVANEAFDLAVYSRAAVILVGAERIDWDRPPAWAAAQDAAPVATPEAAADPPAPRAPDSRFTKWPSAGGGNTGNWATSWRR